MNMRKLVWVVIKFSLATHIMTCLFLMVSFERNEKEFNNRTREELGYIPKTAKEVLHVTTPWQILVDVLHYYVESLNFIVMTQTTVGYGAPYSFIPEKDDPHPFTAPEMIFVMIAQFCGSALFSMIVGEVFQWRREATVEKMVQ